MISPARPCSPPCSGHDGRRAAATGVGHWCAPRVFMPALCWMRCLHGGADRTVSVGHSASRTSVGRGSAHIGEARGPQRFIASSLKGREASRRTNAGEAI